VTAESQIIALARETGWQKKCFRMTCVCIDYALQLPAWQLFNVWSLSRLMLPRRVYSGWVGARVLMSASAPTTGNFMVWIPQHNDTQNVLVFQVRGSQSVTFWIERCLTLIMLHYLMVQFTLYNLSLVYYSTIENEVPRAHLHLRETNKSAQWGAP
jgi:hypothetical protein